MEDRAARARAALAAAEAAVRADSAATSAGSDPAAGAPVRAGGVRLERPEPMSSWPDPDAIEGIARTYPRTGSRRRRDRRTTGTDSPDGGTAAEAFGAGASRAGPAEGGADPGSPDPGGRDDTGDGGPQDPYAVARAIALRQLTFSARSRAELERKLRDKGCDDKVAAAVLDRLTEVGLVDDQAYAEMLIRSQQANRGLSRAGLARELAAKGVDRDVADSALAAVSPGQDRVRAEELVAKRLRAMAGLSADVQARRLAAMLARKGYPSGMVYSVVSQAIDQAAEHRRD